MEMQLIQSTGMAANVHLNSSVIGPHHHVLPHVDAKRFSHQFIGVSSRAQDPPWKRRGSILHMMSQQTAQQPMPPMPLFLKGVMDGHPDKVHGLQTDNALPEHTPVTTRLPVRPARTRVRRALASTDLSSVESHSENDAVKNAEVQDACRSSNEALIAFLRKHDWRTADHEGHFSIGKLVSTAINALIDNPELETGLARSLLQDRGYFGASVGEEMTPSYRSAAIRQWVAEHVFNGQPDAWVARQIVNVNPAQEPTTASLRKQIQHDLYAGGLPGMDEAAKLHSVSSIAHWLWVHVIVDAVPMLQLDDDSFTESLPLTDVQWGQMHAGLLFNQRTGGEPGLINRSEALAVGKLLLERFKEGVVPAEWGDLFRLPALLRQARTAPESMATAGE